VGDLRPVWNWVDEAACRGLPIDLFFGPDGETRTQRDQREQQAKQVCAGCPVRDECDSTASARGDKFGVFGSGEVERRNRRRREQRRAQADARKQAS